MGIVQNEGRSDESKSVPVLHLLSIFPGQI